MVCPHARTAVSEARTRIRDSRQRTHGHTAIPPLRHRAPERGGVVLLHTRIGLHSTVIGPVRIGNHVHLAQGITVSALKHNFADPLRRIDEQGVTTRPIVIEDDVWIGANSVVLPGVRIGRHSVVAEGAVVTCDVPAGSLVDGVPAVVKKRI